jgi:hypothetical protein
MPEPVLEVANRYSTIEAPDGKAMPKQVRMHTMLSLAHT